MFFHILPVSSAGIIIGPIWQDSLHLVLTFLPQHCQHAVHVLGRCLTRARPSNMSARLKNIGRPNFCVAFDRKCFSLSWFSSHKSSGTCLQQLKYLYIPSCIELKSNLRIISKCMCKCMARQLYCLLSFPPSLCFRKHVTMHSSFLCYTNPLLWTQIWILIYHIQLKFI